MNAVPEPLDDAHRRPEGVDDATVEAVGVVSEALVASNNAIVNADTMMQGLKRHWLLRSAFKEKKPKEEKQVTPVRRRTK